METGKRTRRRVATTFVMMISLLSTSVITEAGMGPIFGRRSEHGDIYLGWSLNNENAARVNDSLWRMWTDNWDLYLPSGSYISPYWQVREKVFQINYTDRWDIWGYTTFGGGKRPIFISASAFAEYSSAVLMEVILHESDHHRYGSHTCGEAADVDDNGPFGAAAYYSLKLYHHGQSIDTGERYRAASLAFSRAANNMCGNADAYNRIYTAYAYNIFPAPPPPPPPPPEVPYEPSCGYSEIGYICW